VFFERKGTRPDNAPRVPPAWLDGVQTALRPVSQHIVAGNWRKQMKFRMSPNVAVRTERFSDAVSFYSNVLGFPNRSSDPALGDHDANPLNLFVIEDDEISGPVMELFVEDLEYAREELLANGCEIIRWRGKGQDCYIRDPFGVVFNLWEKPGTE
jgi:predicted enzyme related to lactoylglutathione lyase